MNRSPIALFLASTFVFVGVTSAQPASAPSTPSGASAAVDLSQKLPQDGRLVTGTLENGLQYYVMKHSNPPGRSSIRLLVSTGSLNETDKQRGIAHFLEHMAFNGSENFAPGTVINFFQSMGMQFGRDQNASTGFDKTVYMLDLPDAKPETLDKGTQFFADVAGRLLLQPKEIDAERQIILEEKRTRDSAQWRSILYALPRMMPGSLYGERIPIGTEQTILSVTEKDFRDYYGKWYVPSNMVVAVVADCEPTVAVDLIKKHFAGPSKGARPVDQDLRITPTDKDRAIVFSDKELTNAQIQIMRFDKASGPSTTLGDLRRELVDNIATSAFDRAMDAKVSAGKVTFRNGGAGSNSQVGMFRESSISATGRPEDWQKMLAEITAEARRATLHGLSPKDVAAVKAEIIASAEQAVKAESTAAAPGILNRIIAATADGEPVMSPQQSLDAINTLLPTITAEECSKRFQELFEFKSAVFMISLPVKDGIEVPTEEAFAAAGRKALSVAPEADSQANGATELLSKAPTPGKFAEISQHQASDVYGGWLENGVRFNYRFMDYKKDQVTVSISIAGATLHETAANRGISEAASLALDKPATSKLSSTEIRDLMAGKTIQLRGGGGSARSDAFSIGMSGNPKDIEEGFKIAYLLLTDATIEDALFDQWKKATLERIEARKTSPQGLLFELAPTVIYASDVRVQELTKEQVSAIKLEDAQKWLSSQLGSAPIEVTVVGDIERQKAMDLVATYLGSLPKRDRISNSTFAAERNISKATKRIVDRAVDTETDLAYVVAGFDGPDLVNVADVRAMNMAVRVINTRMIERVREKEALVYSPNFSMSAATAYPGTGSTMFISSTDPHKVERLIEVLGEIFDEFSKGGPSEEELSVARKQFAQSLEKSMKEPSYWFGRLNNITYRGMNLDDMVNEASAMEKLTASEVLAAYNKYYKGKDAMIKCIIRPTKMKETAATPTTGAGAEAPKK